MHASIYSLVIIILWLFCVFYLNAVESKTGCLFRLTPLLLNICQIRDFFLHLINISSIFTNMLGWLLNFTLLCKKYEPLQIGP